MPRSRAFSRTFNGTLLIERLLSCRDLGDGLIDRALSPLFRGRAGRRALKNFSFATLTFRAHLFVAQTANLLLLFSTAPLLLLLSAAPLLLLFSATSLLFLFSKTPLLLLFGAAPLLLLFSAALLLLLRSIVDALPIHQAFVAVWLFLARRRTPCGTCLPSPLQIIGR